MIATIDGTGSFTLPGGAPDHIALMERFVVTAGGDYFFQPSTSALELLAGAPAQSGAPTPSAPLQEGRPPAGQPPAGQLPAGQPPARGERREPGRGRPRRPGPRHPRAGSPPDR